MTHGCVLVAIGGGFGSEFGPHVARRLTLDLLVDLDDQRLRAEASIARALGG